MADKTERPPDATKPESTDPLTLSGVEPATMALGEPDFLLTATGTGFTNNSMLTFNRVNLDTTFKDSHEISATVKASDITHAAVYAVTVKNGAIESNEIDFTFTAELSPQEKEAKEKAEKAAKVLKATPSSRPTVPPPPPPRGQQEQAPAHNENTNAQRQKKEEPELPKSRR